MKKISLITQSDLAMNWFLGSTFSLHKV